jgi:hypothetical protein
MLKMNGNYSQYPVSCGRGWWLVDWLHKQHAFTPTNFLFETLQWSLQPSGLTVRLKTGSMRLQNNGREPQTCWTRTTT